MKRIAILLLIPMLEGPGTVLAQTIRLLNEATIDTPSVSLGQIARITSPTEGEAEQLARLNLQSAPSIGTQELVTLSAVRDKLGGLGVNRAVWSVVGASSCKISRVEGAAQQINQLQERSAIMHKGLVGTMAGVGEENIPDSLAGCIRKLLENQYQPPGGRLVLQFDPSDRSLLALQRPHFRFELAIKRATERNVDVAVQVYARNEQPAGAPVPARTSEARFQLSPDSQDFAGGPAKSPSDSSENLIKSVELRVRAELAAPVVIAKQAINRGQIISVEDVQLNIRPIGLVNSSCRDSAAVIGQQAKRMIHMDEVIQPADLAPLALVHRNKLVTVWIRNGAMLVKTTGRAMQDGVFGEKILVRNEVSHQPFYGVVSGPDTVELDSTAVQEAKKNPPPSGAATAPPAQDRPQAPPVSDSESQVAAKSSGK